MKFTSLAVAIFAFAVPAFAQTVTVSYDTAYDDASLSLTGVACSNGPNGLLTKGYTTLGSLPNFPNVAGASAVTGWGSPGCGTCYKVTYGNTTVPVLAVDVALDGFNLSEETMNKLTGRLGVELGSVDATAIQVDASVCGL